MQSLLCGRVVVPQAPFYRSPAPRKNDAAPQLQDGVNVVAFSERLPGETFS